MINSPQNGPESTKTASVDDGHINAPRGSSIVEIALGPSNSARNGLESDEYVSVDDRKVSAPWSSTIMEIASGPQNGE